MMSIKPCSVMHTGSADKNRLAGKRWKRVVALTGGVGTGKSTVLGMFRKKGAFTLDADRIVHELLDKDPRTRARIKKKLGSSFFKDSRLDKKKLANRIFSSAKTRQGLERILHPSVEKRMREELSRRSGRVAVCDVPLLFEAGWKNKFDAVVVVQASPAVQRARLKKRGGRAADWRARIAAQWPLSRKVEQANFVIDNNGTQKRTDAQVDLIWKRIKEEL